MKVHLYDEEAIAKLTALQKQHQWDLNLSIQWQQGVDLSKPLVPLDENAMFFPGAGKEERLAISHVTGLLIAFCICELEECLLRERKLAFDDVLKRYPVSPEFHELGENFFCEEQKHSQAFRKYIELFAAKVNVEPEELATVMPRVKGSFSEVILRKDLEFGGQGFWWLVTKVEQEFLLMHNMMSPFKKDLDPLYFEVHQRHFEEEARHVSFPYLMLELLIHRNQSLTNKLLSKAGLAYAETLQTAWTGASIFRVLNIEKLKDKHPLFDAVSRVIPVLMEQSKGRLCWEFLTSTPYISSFVNRRYHGKFARFVRSMGVWELPFPDAKPSKLVAY